MTRRVAYVVTSGGRDEYSAMTRLSTASLRISNPGTAVILVTDSLSGRRLVQTRDPLLDEVDEHLDFETPEGDARYRNRFIKTNLRNLIDGTYLFLDSDILIRGELSEVFSVEADIAGARNHSKDTQREQIWHEDQAVLEQMGWHVREDVYINGGAMLCHDTRGARRFGADWHAKWLRSHVETGGYRDQPALNAAICDSGVDLAVLPHRFNAQFKTRVSTARDAAIWHCYAAAGDPPVTEFEALVESMLRGMDVTRPMVETVLARWHPWRRTSWRDDCMARIVEFKGEFGWMDSLWFSGYRGRALRALAYKHLRRMVTGGADS